MIGRFLELSVQTDEILESIGFYECLGFRQLETGEIWSHPYAALSDGRLHLGLHQYGFESPSLTFVLSDLARKLPHLRRSGLQFEFCKTDDDEFNEAGFADPDGHLITLLEARTFSPPAFEDTDFSALGRLAEISLPTRDLDASVHFWENIGFRLAGRHDSPHARALMSGEDIAIGLHERQTLKVPTVTYYAADLKGSLQRMSAAGLVLDVNDPRHTEGRTAVRTKSPEGLPFAIASSSETIAEAVD